MKYITDNKTVNIFNISIQRYYLSLSAPDLVQLSCSRKLLLYRNTLSVIGTLIVRWIKRKVSENSGMYVFVYKCKHF